MRELSKMRVLLIDDDATTREMLSYVLHSFGIRHILMAHNGAEGLRMIESPDLKMDVILCDWNMPCMTGISLLQAVRERNMKLPFIMISSRQDLESITEAKEAGVSAYLPKPIRPGQLESKLKALLQ